MKYMDKYILVYTLLNAGKDDVVWPKKDSFQKVFYAIFSKLSVTTIENWTWRTHSFHLSTWSPKVQLKQLDINKYLLSNPSVNENENTSLSMQSTVHCYKSLEPREVFKKKDISQWRRLSKGQDASKRSLELSESEVSTHRTQINEKAISTTEDINSTKHQSIPKHKKPFKRKIASKYQRIRKLPTKFTDIEEMKQDLTIIDQKRRELFSDCGASSFIDRLANYCEASFRIRMKHCKTGQAGSKNKQADIGIEEKSLLIPNENNNCCLSDKKAFNQKKCRKRKQNEKENVPANKIQKKITKKTINSDTASIINEKNEYTTEITKSKKRKVLSMSVLNGDYSYWSED